MAILWPAEKEAVSHTVGHGRQLEEKRRVKYGLKAFEKSVDKIFPVP